jgi:hypothetical protein
MLAVTMSSSKRAVHLDFIMQDIDKVMRQIMLVIVHELCMKESPVGKVDEKVSTGVTTGGSRCHAENVLP